MSTENSRIYARIESSYLDAWCRFNPESALDAGIEDYAGELPPCDDDSIGIQIVLNEKCLAALEEIDEAQLDEDQRLNFRILRGWASVEHHALLDHDWRYRDPARFLPVSALHQLTVRPLENVGEALLSRLQQIPRRLREARTFLNMAPALIPPVWLDMATQECEAGVHFCHQLDAHPRVQNALARYPALHTAMQDAAQSLESFQHLLERLQPAAQGDFACGRAHFDRLLQQRHFLPINAHTLLGFGERLFAQTERELQQAIDDTGVDLEAIRAHHPDADTLLPAYQLEMQAAHDFLQQHDLVTLPAPQQLSVVPTPQFLRHQIPFAAYLEPSVADLQQQAYYYVTPVHDDAELREHNYAAIAQTSVHEAWPGHHLQFVTANLSGEGGSPLRRLFPCASLYEGWALYCEQMMWEQAFDRHTGQRIVMLRDRLWRALRIIIDVKLHTGEWSLHEAEQAMVDRLGFSHAQAQSECNWYSQAPTVPMSYAVGWALINALRDQVAPASTAELKEFHDRLLDCGSIALPLVIERQFGLHAWQQCCQHVFGEH